MALTVDAAMSDGVRVVPAGSAVNAEGYCGPRRGLHAMLASPWDGHWLAWCPRCGVWQETVDWAAAVDARRRHLAETTSDFSDVANRVHVPADVADVSWMVAAAR